MNNYENDLRKRLLLFSRDFVDECSYLEDRFTCGMPFKLRDGKEFNLNQLYEIVEDDPMVSAEDLEKIIYDSAEGNTLDERMEEHCYDEDDIKGIAGALIAERIWDYTYDYELYGNHFADSSENEIAKDVCESLERLAKEYNLSFGYDDFFIIFHDEKDQA